MKERLPIFSSQEVLDQELNKFLNELTWEEYWELVAEYFNYDKQAIELGIKNGSIILPPSSPKKEKEKVL